MNLLKTSKIRYFIIIFSFLWLSTSCQLIANFNPKIQYGFVNLQSNISILFKKINSDFSKNKNCYSCFKSDYQTINQQIAQLTQEADSELHNDDTVKQLNLLQGSFTQLQALHKEGFKTQQQLQIVEDSINSQLNLILLLENDKPKGGIS